MALARIADFSGGQNTVLSPDKLPGTTGVRLVNANVRTRAVESLIGPADTGGKSMAALDHYGTIDRSAVKWSGLYYWTVNGVLPSYGGTSYSLGVPTLSAAHLAAITLTPGGAGTLDGEYRYAFTWVNSGGWESAPAPVGETYWRTATASTALNIVLDNFPALPGTGYKMRIYRTIGDGGDFYLVAERSVVTAYTDTMTDNDLLLQPALESQNWHPPPTGGQFLTEVGGVFFVAVEDRVYFSVQGNPHAWPSLNWIGVEEDVTALGKAFDGLGVWTANEFRVITGADDLATVAQQTVGPQGCPNWRTPRTLREAPIWQSNDGICMWDGSQILLISSQRVDPPDGNFAVVADDCYWLFHDGGALIFDARGDGIWRETDQTADYAFYSGPNDTLYLLRGSDIWAWGDGDALRYLWKSPAMPGETTAALKRFSRIWITSDGDVEVYFETDTFREHTATVRGCGRRMAYLPRDMAGAWGQITVEGAGVLREVVIEFQEGAL